VEEEEEEEEEKEEEEEDLRLGDVIDERIDVVWIQSVLVDELISQFLKMPHG
jgi:hypothetical protein